MDWAEELRAALAPIGIPCARNTYEGEENTYIVFNASVIPDDYADDEPQHERVLIQVHLYAPATLNTAGMRKDIKKAIRDAGFTYPDETDASDEGSRANTATGEQHAVFESQWAQGV